MSGFPPHVDVGSRDPRVQQHRASFAHANGFHLPAAGLTRWADHDRQWCGDNLVGMEAALRDWKFADPQWAGRTLAGFAMGGGAGLVDWPNAEPEWPGNVVGADICPDNMTWSPSANACVPLGASLSGPSCSPGTYWDDWYKKCLPVKGAPIAPQLPPTLADWQAQHATSGELVGRGGGGGGGRGGGGGHGFGGGGRGFGGHWGHHGGFGRGRWGWGGGWGGWGGWYPWGGWGGWGWPYWDDYYAYPMPPWGWGGWPWGPPYGWW